MKRLEFKVGLFVAIGLVLLAALMLQFSKGMSFLRSKYTIYLKSQDVGGLRERAAVLMSGVQVGSVSRIALAPDGRSVSIALSIYSDFRIHKDARFALEQSGFLGDQYVAIQPTENKGEFFKDGDMATTDAPFNLQQAARSATGLVERLDETAKRLSDAIADIHTLLLNPATLTNVAGAVANLRQMSEKAMAAVDRVETLVATNGPAISQSGSNLVLFTEQLQASGERLNSLLATNAPTIQTAISNLETSSATVRQLLKDVESGKGPAGTLLRDEQMSRDLKTMAYNLSITSSNLNRLGLWGILWKKKDAKPKEPSQPVERLKTPKAAAK